MNRHDADLSSQEGSLGTEPSPEETVLAQMEKEELRIKLYEWLDSLPARKAQVVKYRFGLDDNQPHTLDETALEFDTTRERIHQIEESTIGTLIHNRRHAALYAHRSLKDYMED